MGDDSEVIDFEGAFVKDKYKKLKDYFCGDSDEDLGIVIDEDEKESLCTFFGSLVDVSNSIFAFDILLTICFVITIIGLLSTLCSFDASRVI
jgi:hypothetical protein